MAAGCECPDAAWDHGAGRCPRNGHVRVRRGEVELLLCGDCTLQGDVKLDPDEDDLTVSDLLDWKYEVASDDTLLGFREWKAHRDEEAQWP